MLDIKEIMSCVPHRYPFLLVDRIQELVPGKSVVAIKNVSINEPFFQGHFPGEPVMPGVLILEAMAQAGAMMVLNIPELRGTIAFLTTVNRAKFRRPVVPGDQLVIYTEMGRIFGKMGKVKAHAEVEGKTVAEAELGFMLTKKPEGEK
ncbi:3-hydroxyacyl-ACP dehydratase FabZ [Pyramidobacter piscolens]|uniref:3-hydroxyacyl-ACP dehydratase FabZ n=1 Tax=Pyramidobacter piscolens TaxID=638849 RepID=UPI0024905B53|nr:3-hydroxyacyl-ACP dehydratase FabZ [Pyramidobacter piscolens]